jgi:hypothetical protein
MTLASPHPKGASVCGWALRLWLVWPLFMDQFVGVDAQSCPPGFFCPTATPALPCYAGAFCSANATIPMVCPSGSYCPASSTAPVLCPSGQVSAVGSSAISNCIVLPLYVSTFAGHGAQAASGSGDGVGTNAYFSSPRGLAVNSVGIVFVADSANQCIRRISPTGGTHEKDVCTCAACVHAFIN